MGRHRGLLGDEHNPWLMLLKDPFGFCVNRLGRWWEQRHRDELEASRSYEMVLASTGVLVEKMVRSWIQDIFWSGRLGENCWGLHGGVRKRGIMDDILMWDWVAENVSPLTRMGKALWRGAALAWKWHLVRRITLCCTGGPLLAVSSVGVSDGPLVTHGQVLCPPPLRLPCPTEWWSIYLVGQARNWESPLTPPSGLPPCALHPHSLPALPLKSLESTQFSPSPSQPPQSWLPAVFSLSLAIASSVHWFWSSSSRHPLCNQLTWNLKFKNPSKSLLKWLLLLGWICSMTKGHELAGLAHISSPISNFLSPPHPHGHLLIPWRWNLIPVLFPFWAFAQAVPEILPPLGPT